MHPSASSSTAAPAPPLKRGAACLTCRFLKIRCDGRRPVCTPCANHPKEDPCEYADKPGRSRHRQLEETITHLQSRVQDLEHQNDTLQGAISGSLHLSEASAHEECLQLHTPAASEHAQSPSPVMEDWELDDAEWTVEGIFVRPDHEEPPTLSQVTGYIKTLMATFDSCATQFGFFLDKDHFASVAVLPPDDPKRPCEALIAAVCLWGCHLSPPDSAFSSIESQMLRVALHQRSTMIMDHEANARRVLHSVQAEILLAFYFYRRGTLIEAKVHAAAAASFVTGTGMQGIHSFVNEPPRELEVVSNGDASYLPPPRNVPETGELINGFWEAYLIANQLASVSTTADCTEIFDAPHLLINCPWPLDISAYREGKLPPRASRTVDSFLRCSPESTQRNAQNDSYLAMLTKSTVLLRRATVLTDSTLHFQPSDDEPKQLSTLISDYRSTLPPALLSSLELRNIYVARALSSSAHLRLHKENALQGVERDFAICMDAIRDLFLFRSECDLSSLDCVSPVLGGLWQDACLFLCSVIGSRQSEEERKEIQAVFNFGRMVVEAHAQGNNVLMREYSSVVSNQQCTDALNTEYQLTKIPNTIAI